MKTHIAMMVIIILLISVGFAQWSVTLTAHSTNTAEWSVDIVLGTDSLGTDSFDDGLDIIYPPPISRAAYFRIYDFVVDGLSQDIRSAYSDTSIWEFEYYTTELDSCYVTWNTSGIPLWCELSILCDSDWDSPGLAPDEVDWTIALDMRECDETPIFFRNAYIRFIRSESVKEIAMPQEISFSASPNPFNEKCEITVYIPYSGRHIQKSRLEILDIFGRRVVEFDLNSGINSIIWNAANTPSGIYFAAIKGLPEPYMTGLFLVR